MEMIINDNSIELGEKAAKHASEVIMEAIQKKGKARIILSTGASQFGFFQAFVKLNIEWSHVEMFHLDEYVGLSERHPASFRKYLKERFTEHVPINEVHFVNGDSNIEETIHTLTEQIAKAPIDLALIGIGENGHIAFNDPPADFETREAYIVVNLDEQCKNQQVGEGWFPGLEEVPNQAISMTVHQIMQSDCIISCVPHRIKANAILNAIEGELSPMNPASILKRHSNWHLYLDKESASLLV
ncbi:glucosamine-6-phosphate deaminase [Paenibacillus sp. LMG 31461]|uniref:Glucosamine-6-phosphate deaminase n=1 Tax=Paenibacillus plantarum TaxID=2654975 RepID=A0ABX1XAE2_9BACL|nr:glucosamine-6-phosphate deaminase [Paenibacillus plantarum]NOU65407.1 glucosamine-6-phosphate deaminase [Paenibacillus plantarum]